jgi:hypothetical protein
MQVGFLLCAGTKTWSLLLDTGLVSRLEQREKEAFYAQKVQQLSWIVEDLYERGEKRESWRGFESLFESLLGNLYVISSWFVLWFTNFTAHHLLD